MDLPTTVAPFILRAVSLLGIDSVMCPQAVRREAWKRLATDLDRGKLQTMTNEIQLPGVLVAAPQSSTAAFGAESWSRSGKRVQDLATISGQYA